MSLGLRTAVLAVVDDLEPLLGVYGLLIESDIPPKVQELFGRLRDNLYNDILNVRTALQKGKVGSISNQHVAIFNKFKNQLMDLEIFIDPEQVIPKSGHISDSFNLVPWMGPTGLEADTFCQTFQHHISVMEETCKALLSDLGGPNLGIRDQGSPQDRPVIDERESSQNHTQNHTPFFGHSSALLVSPFLKPYKDPVLGSPFPSISPIMSPLASPFLHPQIPQQLPSFGSLFNLGDLPPIDISGGHTLVNLPSLNSSSLQRPKKPDRSKKTKTIAERRIQELIESQYGNTMAAGVKRKRQILDHAPFSGIPQHVSERSLITRTPPPTYQAPDSPRLGPSNPPDDIGVTDGGESISGTVWSSLDDLVDALPSTSPHRNIQSKGKGKQRADHEGSLEENWDRASSIHTGSTSATISSRDSIFSTASRERTFDEGTCIMFVKPPSQQHGVPRGRPMALPVAHLEIKRTSQGGGRGLVIVTRSTNGQEAADNLFLPARNENSKPFLEHEEIVEATRSSLMQTQPHMAPNGIGIRPQIRGHIDEDIAMSNTPEIMPIAAIVFFAPYPSKHPQYAFSNMQDAWDFVSATSSSSLDLRNLPDPDWTNNNLSLVCSASVTSVKSALTHGNVEEAGTVTMQVWERDTSEGAFSGTSGKGKQLANKRNHYERFVRLFRNKSPQANAPVQAATVTSAASGRITQANLHASNVVLDIDCKFLKPPDTERRTGKVTFAFRDISTSEGGYQNGLGQVLKGMRYLKVAFRDDEAKREFLHEAGFGT